MKLYVEFCGQTSHKTEACPMKLPSHLQREIERRNADGELLHERREQGVRESERKYACRMGKLLACK